MSKEVLDQMKNRYTEKYFNLVSRSILTSTMVYWWAYWQEKWKKKNNRIIRVQKDRQYPLMDWRQQYRKMDNVHWWIEGKSTERWTVSITENCFPTVYHEDEGEWGGDLTFIFLFHNRRCLEQERFDILKVNPPCLGTRHICNVSIQVFQQNKMAKTIKKYYPSLHYRYKQQKCVPNNNVTNILSRRKEKKTN